MAKANGTGKTALPDGTDVDLSEKGHEEAKEAGRLLKEEGIVLDRAYTSYLKRAIHTLNHVLDELDENYIPVEKTWKLNERHYEGTPGTEQSRHRPQIRRRTGSPYGGVLLTGCRPFWIQKIQERRKTSPTTPKFRPMNCRWLNRSRRPLNASFRTIWNILNRKFATERPSSIAAHGNSLRALVKYLDGIGDERNRQAKHSDRRTARL